MIIGYFAKNFSCPTQIWLAPPIYPIIIHQESSPYGQVNISMIIHQRKATTRFARLGAFLGWEEQRSWVEESHLPAVGEQ